MHTRGPVRGLLFVGLLALASPAFAGDPIMPVSEVRAGMRGYGKTVFKGDTIERFEIEVLDVMRNNFPRQDQILIRCYGPVCEKANVIAGMSGSPIYIDDKVIGALAYAWGFEKEAIAGVTPIEVMLADARLPREIAEGGGAGGDCPSSLSAEAATQGAWAGKTGTPGLYHPIETPLLVSGLPGRSLAHLQDFLAPYGIVPMQGASGTGVPGAPRPGPAPFLPGAAIGVQLIRGDLDATAIGTVSYVEGDTIVAFGHPFFNGGEHTLPMMTAWIHGVLPSLSRSFKFGSPAHEVGALVRDCNTSIVGVLGRRAPMIPVTVTIRNERTGRRETYSFEVLRHRQLSAGLLASVVDGAMEVTESAMGDATIGYRVKAEFEKYGAVEMEDTYGASGTPTGRILSDLFGLMSSPFEEVPLLGLTVEATVQHESRRASITTAWLACDEAKPGETVQILVKVRPAHQPETVQRLCFAVPADLQNCDLDLTIAGAASVEPDLPPARTFADSVGRLKAEHVSTGFGLVVPLPALNLRLDGRSHPRLPNSVLGAWVPNIVDEAEIAQDAIRVFAPATWIVGGSAKLKLKVRK